MNSIQLSPLPSSEEPVFDSFALDELKDLEQEACRCKTATKIAGCILLPISWIFQLGRCLTCAARSEDRDEHPTSHIEYSKWTTCDGKCCWLPKLRPEDRCDQVWQALDPWVCCLCCDKGDAAHYLPPEKQRQWVDLKKKMQNGVPDAAEFEQPFIHIVQPAPLYTPPFRLIGPQGVISRW